MKAWSRDRRCGAVVFALVCAIAACKTAAGMNEAHDGGADDVTKDSSAASDSSDARDAADAREAADAAVLTKSCAKRGPGRSDCGPDHTESCCTSPIVAGGTFFRGYDGVDGQSFVYKTDPATVSSFRLDRFEVTVGRFRGFVGAVVDHGWRPPAGSGKHAHLNADKGLNANDGGYEPGWDVSWNANLAPTAAAWDSNLACYPMYLTWTPTAGAQERRPIACLTWYEAAAFCIWDDGFLPSEAEWNYAAAGGGGATGQRVFAWSIPPMNTAIDCAHANYGGPSFPANACPPGPGAKDVGSLSPAGDGAYGQADLTGNVWEWLLDWHKDFGNPCTDCVDATPIAYRVLKGGSFDDIIDVLPVSHRISLAPGDRNDVVGMRCARAAP